MSRDYRLFLDDIKTACEKILRYTRNMTFEQFTVDVKTFDAVVRNLEIIGEASKNIPEEVRQQHPEIDWRKMAGLRDIVAHEYFGIDEEVLWDIVESRIADLLERVREMPDAEDEDSGRAR